MKAWVLHDINDLRWEERDLPAPGEGWVRIRVVAAGVCGSDLPRIFQTGAHRMPLVPGHEFAGEVDLVGAGVEGLARGQRVSVFPLIPCRKCGPCRMGHVEMCRDYDYVGSRRDGAFAEFVTIPAWNLLKLPDNVSDEAGAMMEPLSVAVHAMRTGIGSGSQELPKEASVAVCGLGPIGFALILFLMQRGYRNLYLIGNKDFQKNRAVSLGIPEERFFDSRQGDAASWLYEMTGGTDLFFECTGRNEALSIGVEGAGPVGRIVLVGNPHGNMALDRQIYWKILRNQLSLSGIWNSFYNGGPEDDWHYAMSLLQSGQIKPESLITHRYALSELDRALSVMQDSGQDHCKVMLI